jgi:hypothetical protein
VSQYKMFSDESLTHFRAFVAQNEADAAAGISNKNPSGAFDAVSSSLKNRLARDAHRIARDAHMESTGASMLDPDTIQAILKLVTEAHGEDSTAGLMRTIHAKYPGACGDMPGEDEADADWPPANAGGKPGANDDEDWSPESGRVRQGRAAPLPGPPDAGRQDGQAGARPRLPCRGAFDQNSRSVLSRLPRGGSHPGYLNSFAGTI